jgi:hypothetical protein
MTDARQQGRIHSFDVWHPQLADESGKRRRDFELHRVHPSAECHGDGQSRFAGFLVLTVHILGGLSHRRDRRVEVDPMSGFDLVSGKF